MTAVNLKKTYSERGMYGAQLRGRRRSRKLGLAWGAGAPAFGSFLKNKMGVEPSKGAEGPTHSRPHSSGYPPRFAKNPVCRVRHLCQQLN